MEEDLVKKGLTLRYSAHNGDGITTLNSYRQMI